MRLFIAEAGHGAPRPRGGAGGAGSAAPDELVLAMRSMPPGAKGNRGMLPCSSAHRATPLLTSENTTQCLVAHVLARGVVFLNDEASKPQPGAALCSHALYSHSGAVFLHVLDTSPTLMEALPVAEKLGGGAVSDYRLVDFRDLVAEHEVLSPPADARAVHSRAHLLRRTRYFPLARSKALILELAELVRGRSPPPSPFTTQRRRP